MMQNIKTMDSSATASCNKRVRGVMEYMSSLALMDVGLSTMGVDVVAMAEAAAEIYYSA